MDEPGRGREASFSSARLSFLSSVYEDDEILHKGPPRACSSLLTVGNDSLEIERSKVRYCVDCSRRSL